VGAAGGMLAAGVWCVWRTAEQQEMASLVTECLAEGSEDHAEQ
jgi:hypothetical protein